MKTCTLDVLMFKLEKLFLIANSYVDYPRERNYELMFYALADEVKGVQDVYSALEPPLKDLC